jgi:hypothetical protein
MTESCRRRSGKFSSASPHELLDSGQMPSLEKWLDAAAAARHAVTLTRRDTRFLKAARVSTTEPKP